jgi:DNA-binding MarR family transcriptional regulator
MIDLADNEARHIAILYRQLLKQLERELAPLGLGPGRYPYLFALYIEDGRSQQALADVVVADKAAAARALARLEADGYIRRAPDAADRRALRVYLTARSRRLRPVIERAAASTIAGLTAALAEPERAQLRQLLRTLATAQLGR